MKFPRIGPKLAPVPTDLDENTQERLDSFMFFARRDEMVRISNLVWLAVISYPDVDFGHGRFKDTKETITLEPHNMVMTSQSMVGAKKISYYIERLRLGEDIGPMKVTDQGPGGWYHLDGLHRLLAARILGRTVEARIYR